MHNVSPLLVADSFATEPMSPVTTSVTFSWDLPLAMKSWLIFSPEFLPEFQTWESLCRMSEYTRK